MRTIDSLLTLSRFTLTEEEKRRYQDNLDAMLGMMEHIKQTDVAGVAPLYNPLDEQMLAVADESIETAQDRERLQQLSNATRDHFYLVPKVIG